MLELGKYTEASGLPWTNGSGSGHQHAALSGGHEEVAKLFMDQGADINKQGAEHSNLMIQNSA